MGMLRRMFAALHAVPLIVGGAEAAVQGVFAHYMVGGMSSISQALADVSQAQSLGLDAFALNVQQPDEWWARASLDFLFDAAGQTGFKLFFSMDMAVIPSPSACVPVLQAYASHPAYYRYQNRPFLSTFRGGNHYDWLSALQSVSPQPYFVPNFEDHSSVQSSGGAYPYSIFTTHPYLDGVMGWETAWPHIGQSPVSPIDDSAIDAANLNNCRAQAKSYMLPVSSHQSKHLRTHGNWLRPGAFNLPRHMALALRLQPEFVELLTWNDVGEGHYFGNIWPESLPDPEMRAAVDVERWNHDAWRGLIRPFVAALKSGAGTEGVYPMDGKMFSGVFWYRPLLKAADGGLDWLGLWKPDGWMDVEDKVNVAVLLGQQSSGWKVRVWSGGRVVGEYDGRPGMNMYQAEAGMGDIMVQVLTGDWTLVGEGKGAMAVTDRIDQVGGLYNFNYQVVEIAPFP
ncbi:glycoside hydrolase family 71 protein [Parathielavia hyrcaniae]|uniref:Glycoside hydrolase family 71 protein n=1 Tax=Parathielavia hyrcaniae TaxID=113614 RepID=A0AAN6Q0I9_9PEZI|nr:glycoside hydrolase family 71 protein [Parathielavia hyrcaniae]